MYGWIEVGEKLEHEPGQHLPLHLLANLAPRKGNGTEHDWEKQLYRVKSFWEKPRAKLMKALYQSGCLWNTMILTGKVWMLLLFQTLTPRLSRKSTDGFTQSTARAPF
ncbi:MAG: hypothetical protein HYY11_01675 [Candidatus Methylomirabilis oxyfera]|nr:hypothetical protein [Candidatus Methylomirabilis oxyfera]